MEKGESVGGRVTASRVCPEQLYNVGNSERERERVRERVRERERERERKRERGGGGEREHTSHGVTASVLLHILIICKHSKGHKYITTHKYIITHQGNVRVS
jgi:hypothetical protein